MMIDSFFFGGGFQIMFSLTFILIFGMIVFSVIQGIGQWNKNNHSPKLTVEATVVSKRADTRVNHHHHEKHMHTSYSTYYYVTFQVESGDRMELCVSGNEYGMLVEGDWGKLTFQGTRFLEFVR